MRPFELHNLNVYHVMGNWSKSSFSKIHEITFFVLYLLISPTKSTFFFGGGGEILVALDTYAKKINPPSMVLGGGAR